MQYVVTILTDYNQLEELEDLLNSSNYIFSVELFPGLDKKDTLFNVYSDDREAQQVIFDTVSRFVAEKGKKELLVISKEILQDKDWQEAWKKHFEPIIAGRLVVGISAEELKSFNQAKVIIDPGMAFGNGSHPTTKGCLIQIDRYLEKGMRVLDFGSGSGVLAIACDKLGASFVEAVDNDELAVNVCQRNVQHNNSKVNVYSSKEFSFNKDYDLIIANITVDVLIKFFKYLTEGQKNLKYLILSGISDFRKTQMDLFLKTEGISPFDKYEEDGWYTYLLKY